VLFFFSDHHRHCLFIPIYGDREGGEEGEGGEGWSVGLGGGFAACWEMQA